ncbi:MAG: PA2817 family protein [Thalassolituus sp.]
MNNRLSYHLELLQETLQRLEKAAAHDSEAIGGDILQQFRDLIDQLTEHSDSAYDQGQDLIAKIATHQPQLMPTLDRALLWFFGGECLHFLTDDEINRFQHLDEMAAEAEADGKEYDYRSAGRSLH